MINFSELFVACQSNGQVLNLPLLQEGSGFKSQFGAFLWSFSGSSSFALIRDSELPLNVDVCACVSCVSCDGVEQSRM